MVKLSDKWKCIFIEKKNPLTNVNKITRSDYPGLDHAGSAIF